MPRPEKHVFVCVQQRPMGHPRGSCAEKDCAAVMQKFLDEVQKRMLFEKISVTNTGCLGPCITGPSVLVYPEGVMYGGVTADDVTEIFDKHLVGNEPVERLKVPEEVWG